MMNMNALQAMVDKLGAVAQADRAASQMTLGGLIAELERVPPDAQVLGFGGIDSYRGYYCDLAFEPVDTTETAASLLTRCRECVGQTFQGYKGGDYTMQVPTPLWIAMYGSCGKRLMGLNTGSDPIAPVTAEDE